MKKMQLVIVTFILFASTSLAVFDYEINNSYYHGVFDLNGQKSLLILGSGAEDINADNFSYIEVQNTSALLLGSGGIYTMDLNDNSTLNYLGGETGVIKLRKDASAVLSGGRIDYLRSYQDSDLKKHITFICDVDSVELTGNLLTGDWLGDRGSFSIRLEDQAGYDSVYSNINFIPEPTALALFGLGALALRRKK